MGLEPKAAANVNDDVGWDQWKWMKNYRVWEANRKVFLYPENWIEAELRDDKSFLFQELENELQQNELTEFTAEDAFIRYLEKLDNIAFLEVAATWYQTDIKTMHVFARTKGGDPAIYYYRRFEKERYWTPWEKVELDITGRSPAGVRAQQSPVPGLAGVQRRARSEPHLHHPGFHRWGGGQLTTSPSGS